MKTKTLNRVHGNITIRRREKSTLVNFTNYIDYKPFLKEDFKGICGYCGKKEETFFEKFQIDHFAPKRFTKLINEYSNLVFCCPKCNRHKRDKWATDNAQIPIENNRGFVDPASIEFDDHLMRDGKGNIIGKTLIGKYMCKELRFDIRPISLIWKINKLKELEENLRTDNSLEGLRNHRLVSIELESILKDLIYNYNE